MSRLVLAGVVLSASLAIASNEAKQNIDVFLSSQSARPPVELRALPRATREQVRAGRISQLEPRLGVPSFFWAARDPAFRSLRDQGVKPEQAARRYLLTYAPLYGLDGVKSAERATAKVHDTGDGAVIVSFALPEHGRRVMGEELKVIMDQKLQLVALSGWLSPMRKEHGSFRLTEQTAIAQAYLDLTGLGLESNRLARLAPAPAEGEYRRWAIAGEAHPARTRAVYFASVDGLIPGWYVELHVADPEGTSSRYFSYVVSAADGRLLMRHDLTRYDSFGYRVWADTSGLLAPYDGPQGNAPSPHPTGTLNQYNPPFVSSNLITLQNGPISTNDPWLPSGATQTQGNNTFAYADLKAPDGYSSGDPVPTATAPGVFDRTYDVTQSPGVSNDQIEAATTQLFYDVNFFHDWYYDVGFDELAGNGQTDNLGRGGVANDPVLAEAQDYSGKNNSNMQTPADGASPVMQMYVFDGGAGAKVTVNGTGGVDWASGSANFGPQTFNVTGDAVLVSSGSALSDGCSSALTGVTGKIAVVVRGNCQFSSKLSNAQSGGALGLVIINNQSGPANDIFGSGNYSIPVVSLSQTDGQTLQTRAAAGTVNLTLHKDPVVDRDGTIDNAIVAHEWGHYIQNRLIGDGNGLNNNQGGGMGEGWSDFHAMLLVVKDGDDQLVANANWSGVYALAAYTSYGLDPNGYYYGIRRVPYSTDMTKNGLTFKHIADGYPLPSNVPTSFGADGSQNSEVHNTGEVWATMLWECYAALLRDTPGRLSFDEANRRMRAYIVAAYKGTPVNPTVLEARDALLAVASAKDAVDFGEFWTAFAKRGAGMSATGPDRSSWDNNPVNESYTTGNALEIASITLDDSVSSCDHDGVLDNEETGLLTVTVKNTGVGALSGTVGQITSSTPGVTLGASQVQFPASQPFQVVKATVPVSLHGVAGKSAAEFSISVNDPSLAVAGPVVGNAGFRVDFDVNGSGATADDVEAPTTLWTSSDDPTGNTSADWARFENSATEHWWFGPDSPSPADVYLTSPPLHVGSGPFSVSFDHRYDFEYDASTKDAYDGAVIEVSTDSGATWLDVGTKLATGYNGTLSSGGSNPLAGRPAFTSKSTGYPAFIHDTLSFGTDYAGQTILLRFRIGSDDAVAQKGWELDNIAFTGLTDQPFATVVSDPNQCTNGAPVVTVGPDQSVPEGQMVTLVATATDPDNDPVSFSWSQTGGPAVALQNGTFVAPSVDQDTQLTFQVVATDGKAVVGPFTTHVTVLNVNHPPVVTVAPQTVTVDPGAMVTITATATDPDGDVVSGWAWTQSQGPAVALDGAETQIVSFTAPQVEVDTHFVIEVKATDGSVFSLPVSADVLVKAPLSPPSKGGGKKSGCGCDGTAQLAPFGLLLLAAWRSRRRR